MRSETGLTLLETVVAIGICAIVLGMLATVTTSSLRESRQGNLKTQATQVLDTIGRRIVGGQDTSVLLPAGQNLTIEGDEIDDMMALNAFRDGAFTATIANTGTFTVGTTRLQRYSVTVCYSEVNQERCVRGVTLGIPGVI